MKVEEAVREQFRMCNTALLMGGDTRVGLEPATPDEARAILKLKGLDKVKY